MKVIVQAAKLPMHNAETQSGGWETEARGRLALDLGMADLRSMPSH
jgi:hypothetical protein